MRGTLFLVAVVAVLVVIAVNSTTIYRPTPTPTSLAAFCADYRRWAQVSPTTPSTATERHCR